MSGDKMTEKRFIPQWYCENCKQEFGFVGSYYDLEDGKHCPNNGCNALLISIE